MRKTLKQFFLLCLCSICTIYLFAQSKTKEAPKAPAETPKKDSLPSLTEKVKSSKKTEGLLTLYQDTVTGSVKLYIKKNQLGKEFIYQSFSMGGPAQLFLNQNMIRTNWIFKIQKVFDRLEFCQVNTNFYYDPLNAISRAANVDVSEAVFYADKILAQDSTGYLVDVDGLFLSDKLDPIKPNLPPNTPPNSVYNLGNLNTAKSKYDKIRSFPKNTDVIVELAFDNPSPVNMGGKEITDARYNRIRFQHSFIEMPVNDYRPRRDDPRVGFFTQEINDQTSKSVTPYHDLINRWYLKKKDPAAALSEPVEPIVWWVENTTPVELRQIIFDAGLKWNAAFEKAGFKNAVVMKMMPDTATWDPADISYNVIRWVSSDLGYAIGPSFVNPRTGQILGADITVDWVFVPGLAMEESLYGRDENINVSGDHTQLLLSSLPKQQVFRNCMYGKEAGMQFSGARTALEIEGAGSKEMGTLQKEFFTELILHEMGHTMGLMHNMKASQMLSPAELKDIAITSEWGVMGSVMDYSTVNLSPDSNKRGNYYMSKVGPYDKWAIEYGYTECSAANEEAVLRKIASRSNDPKLAFGNDADIVDAGSGIDPRVMVWDMSNDMVTYATDRFKLMNTLVGKIKTKYTMPGESYSSLTSHYYFLLNQRYGMAIALSRYVGGVYVDRSFPDQQSGNKPFTPVPVTYQKQALNVIGKNIFSPTAFSADTYLFPYLQRQRRGFNFSETTENPKPERILLGIQKEVLTFLLNPTTMQRINTSSLYGNTYSLADVFGDMTNDIFKEDLKTNVNLYRQNLQAEYVKRLTVIVMTRESDFDYPSKAAAYLTLRKIKLLLATAVSTNEQTKAHRAVLNFMIDKALVVK
jgi:Met-zincin/Domain of unknown function (DUF5117)